MADTFEDLGIDPAIAAGAEEIGWERPAGLQRDAVPVLRRGNNAVLQASSGSGVVGAYGLAVLDRLAADDGEPAGPRALVLVPDAATATRVASSLARLSTPAGLAVRALGTGWTGAPDLLVASVADAVGAVRDSALKLDGLLAVVVHGADDILATDQGADLETLVDAVPAGAQRVLVADRLDRVERFVEGHVRRAMTIPARSAPGSAPDGASVRYAVVAPRERDAALVAVLDAVEGTEVAVVCRTRDDAEELSRELAGRGVPVEGADESADGDRRVLVLPTPEADQRSTRAAVVSAHVPMDDDALAELHGGGGAILVTPREVTHLQRIAERAGLTLDRMTLPAATPSGAIEEVRERVRRLLRDGDLSADLALLEPLLEEHGAAEVAAAALHLARTAGPARAGSAPPAGERSAAAAATPAPRRSGSAPPPDSATWAHLFVTIGKRDGVGPGDLVGAITGEAGLSGDQVGKVDIRESHSTVEVPSHEAARVIEALNGRTLRGRSLRVDYDRKDRDRGGASGRQGGSRPGSRPGGRPGGKPGKPGGRRPGGRTGGPRRGGPDRSGPGPRSRD